MFVEAQTPIKAATTGQGGIPAHVPLDAVSQAAYEHAAAHVNPLILTHSMRVFLLAAELSKQESADWHLESQLPVLFTTCIFHDIGTSGLYNTGSARFEIEGADAAVAFLTTHGIQKAVAREAWLAIALHDTPQIPERLGGLTRFVRLAVAADFKRAAALQMFDSDLIRTVEHDFPRGEIEKILGDAVVEQAIGDPEKAPAACWPGTLYRAKLANPEWTGVNKAF